MESHNKSYSSLQKIALAYIACIFVFEVFAVLSAFVWPTSQATSWLSLTNVRSTTRELDMSQTDLTALPAGWLRAAEKFHKNNPEIIRRIVLVEGKKKDSLPALRRVRKLVQLDQKNVSTYSTFFKTKAPVDRLDGLMADAALLAQGFLENEKTQRVTRGLALYPPVPEEIIRNQHVDYDTYTSTQATEVLARLCYLFGLSLLTNNPEGTLYWWRLASDIDPGVSYYAAESASVLYGVMRDKESAIALLRVCQQNFFAGVHCSTVIGSIGDDNIPPPGYYKEQVLGLLFTKLYK